MATTCNRLQIHTTVEWASRIGANVRQARIARDLTQEDVARRASISVKTLHNLEAGRATMLSTLIKVVKVLDRADWLDGLDEGFGELSPMELLRQQRRQSKPRRRATPKTGV